MNKSINIIYSLVALLFLMGSCAVTDVDRKVDFNNFRTFAWGKAEIKTENPVFKSDLINRNIKTTVESEFAKRGIVLDEQNPDMVVSYQTYTEKREETKGGYYGGYPFFGGYSLYRYYPLNYGWGFPYAGGAFPRTETVTEGTLIVDIEDRNTNELIWRGTVSGNVDNIKNLQKQIQRGIKAIMKKYPTPAGERLNLKDERPII